MTAAPEARPHRAHAPVPAPAGRRPIDPTRDPETLSAAETEFMRAMQAYKTRSGRMFPTWSEVLEVLRDLGYEQAGGAGAH